MFQTTSRIDIWDDIFALHWNSFNKPGFYDETDDKLDFCYEVEKKNRDQFKIKFKTHWYTVWKPK